MQFVLQMVGDVRPSVSIKDSEVIAYLHSFIEQIIKSGLEIITCLGR